MGWGGGGECNKRWEGEREGVWRQRRGIVFWLRFRQFSTRFIESESQKPKTSRKPTGF